MSVFFKHRKHNRRPIVVFVVVSEAHAPWENAVAERSAVQTSDVVNQGADTGVLGRAARRFRVFHTVIAIVELTALGHVWTCALARRRDKLLGVSVSALLIEGVALIVGRGNCPLGPLQRKLGDPVPLFEVVLPPRTAKAAVPVLAAISLVGLGLVLLRPPFDTDARDVADRVRNGRQGDQRS